MASYRHLLAGFLAGEIDPMLSGRVDTDQYAYGLEACENWIATAEGPLVKRGGFEFISAAQDDASRISAFRFSVTQEYLLEWGTNLRLFTNDLRIESPPGTPVEVTVPYAPADAPALSFQQNYDRLYIDHASYPPASLLRTGAASFTHADLIFLNGPFKDDNTDETVTVTVSGTTGAINVTCTAAIFAAGHVGGLMRIQAKDFSDIKAWEAGMKGVATNDKVRSDGKVYKAVDMVKVSPTGVTGSSTPIHTEGAEWDGQGKQDELNAKGHYGVKWEYVHDRFGIVEITGFTSATQVSATVKRRLPDSCTSVATHRWALGCFSAAEGWPGLVSLAFGRMIHIKDFDLIASVVGDFGGGRANYAAFSDSGAPEPDLAFRRRLATMDPPVWIAGDRKLLLGTASRELAVGPTNSAAAISGDNITADPQSFYGSEAIAPVQLGVQTVFVERGGRRARSANYDFGSDRYVAADLTAAARHITASGIVTLCVQRNPQPLIHAVRGDGQVASHADSRSDIKGWSRQVLGGGARALWGEAIIGPDGKRDALWLLVERVNGVGDTVREIWKQAYWRELGEAQDQSFYVDGGVRIAATAGQTVFTGLDHLAGQAVAVLAGGAVIPGRSVALDGSLTLPAGQVPATSYTLIVGLAYRAYARTLPPEVKVRSGSVVGMLKRARKVVLRLLETLGIKVAGHTIEGGDGPFEEVIDRKGDDLMDAPIPLFTGATNGLVDTAFDKDGRVSWISEDPLPALVTSTVMTLELDTGDA
ncbi:hypothetical protein [Novosphingobium sp.]|uniref:hypothetical protein n=1 Tax=Novosphingobium sp. TaxID=1874826 RepID=UPI00286E94D0|nr:hypothetical protein [Novosphingobium sp.]